MKPKNVDEVMRDVLVEYAKKGPGFLQSSPVLNEVCVRLGCRGDTEAEQLVLTAWHQLLGADGVLAWGYNLSNPGPPFVHLTQEGRQALEHGTIRRASQTAPSPAKKLVDFVNGPRGGPLALEYYPPVDQGGPLLRIPVLPSHIRDVEEGAVALSVREHRVSVPFVDVEDFYFDLSAPSKVPVLRVRGCLETDPNAETPSVMRYKSLGRTAGP